MSELPAARVTGLWRYPVKSMQGGPVPTAELTPDGVAGDREWGVVDLATGLTASAKHPARFGALPTCAARLDEPHGPDGAPVVTLPDGREVRAGTIAADAALSALLGRDVALRRAAVGWSTTPRCTSSRRRASRRWPLRSPRAGPTSGGSVPTLAQPGLARSPATLRTVAAAKRPDIGGLGRRPGVGVYATVVAPGRVRPGDVLVPVAAPADGRDHPLELGISDRMKMSQVHQCRGTPQAP